MYASLMGFSYVSWNYVARRPDLVVDPWILTFFGCFCGILRYKSLQNTLFVEFFKIFHTTIVQVYFALLRSATSLNLMLISIQIIIWSTVRQYKQRPTSEYWITRNRAQSVLSFELQKTNWSTGCAMYNEYLKKKMKGFEKKSQRNMLNFS